MTNGTMAPLLKEPVVRELLALLAANDTTGQNDLLAIIQQIAGMEKQLNAAVEELAAIRRELATARESPVKSTLHNVSEALEKNVTALRERLGSLKLAVVEGCKKAMAAFREKGVAVLAHTAQFFHIRPALEAVGRELDRAIAHDNKALSSIAAASKEYHGAGLHLKNLVRAVRGREPATKPKGPGKLAHALAAPFKRERSLFNGMKKRVTGALDHLGRLEEAAERPPIRKTMEEMNAKAVQDRKDKEKTAPSVQHDER